MRWRRASRASRGLGPQHGQAGLPCALGAQGHTWKPGRAASSGGARGSRMGAPLAPRGRRGLAQLAWGTRGWSARFKEETREEPGLLGRQAERWLVLPWEAGPRHVLVQGFVNVKEIPRVRVLWEEVTGGEQRRPRAVSLRQRSTVGRECVAALGSGVFRDRTVPAGGGRGPRAPGRRAAAGGLGLGVSGEQFAHGKPGFGRGRGHSSRWSYWKLAASIQAAGAPRGCRRAGAQLQGARAPGAQVCVSLNVQGLY